MASPYIAAETPIQRLECESAWSALTRTEQYYAYHLSRACWEGGIVAFFQRSYESPGLLLLFQTLFGDVEFESKAKEAGISDKEWDQFIAYAAGVLSNAGNYHSFGDTKILPELPRARFNLIVGAALNSTACRIWTQIGDDVYEEKVGTRLDFPEENGRSSYYSPNVSKADAEFVKAALFAHSLTELHWNSRLFKSPAGFQVRIASCSQEALACVQSFTHEGQQIHITAGDFSLMMERLVRSMTKALAYTANPAQEAMLLAYIRHFVTGDIDQHKTAQRHWIKDLQPVVETNIGFIENYADPLRIRSEFEGFVSIVNKPVSAKFGALVSRAEELIRQLPWGRDFEKDKFTPPDFTSLEVLTFATSGVPIGINIPNYDEIRQHDGFKNVNLGNAYPKMGSSDLPFLEADDIALIQRMYDEGETVAVALHELLGHGSGKLLSKAKDGTFNFPPNIVNPATGAPVDSWYNEGETWSSKFGALSNAYEECRAETVATYLALFDLPFELFAIEAKEDARRMMWIYMAYAGLKGLLYYSPEAKAWGQAHCSARWVIFRVMVEAGLASVEFVGENDMKLRLDYAAMQSKGKAAIGEFLMKLHCFKSTGDFKRGEAFFQHYNEVDEIGLKMREIVIVHKKPRRMNIQGNLLLGAEGPVLKQYPETFQGVIQSFQDRFPREDPELLAYWEAEYALMRRLALGRS